MLLGILRYHFKKSQGNDIVDKPDREAVLSYAPSSTTGKGSNFHKTSQEPLPPSLPPAIDSSEMPRLSSKLQRIKHLRPANIDIFYHQMERSFVRIVISVAIFMNIIVCLFVCLFERYLR